MKPEAKMEYPETPAWTMFFDGPLYQKYKEFMQEKDFSKILLSSKLQLANTADPDTHSEQPSKHDEWWETDIDVEHEKATNPNIYSSVVSEDFYRNLKDDKKRIKRRTRAFIVLGIVILAALAFGTALVIHYFFIPSAGDPSSDMNISLSDNISSTFANLSGISTTKVTVTPLTVPSPKSNDLSNLLDRFIKKHIGKEDIEKSSKTSIHTTTSSLKTDITSPSTTSSVSTTTVQDSALAASTTSVTDTSTFITVSLAEQQTTIAAQPTAKPSVTSYEDFYDLFGMDDYSTTAHQTEGDEIIGLTTELSKGPITTLATVTSEIPQHSTTTDSITETTSYITSPSETTAIKNPTTSTSDSVMTATDIHTVTDVTKIGTTVLDITSTGVRTESYTYSNIQKHTKGLSTETYNQSVPETNTQTIVAPESTSFTRVIRETSSIIPVTTDETIPYSPSKMENAVTSTTLLRSTQLPTTSPPSTTTRLTTTPPTTTLPTTSPTTMSSTTLHATTSSTVQPSTTPSTPSPTTTLSTIPPTTTPSTTPSTTRSSTTLSTTTPSTTPSMTTSSTNPPSTTTSTIPPTITSLPDTTVQSTSIPTTVLPTTTTTRQTTTTVQQTTLPENYNILTMEPTTAYAGEITRINCNVKYAVHWKSLLIRERMFLSPLSVRVFPNGRAKWSWSREERHDVSIELTNQDGLGTDINVDLIISDVQCKDSKIYQCFLFSDVENRNASSKLMVIGKPSNQMHLTLGPSVIENKALRLTAEWTAGYPTPWTNISWLAIDVNNKTYNLENYGQYREYEIQVDHQKCETRLKNSFVIFPTMELNDTTVIVRPNLNTIKKFVTKEMAVGLNNVRSGSEKILVIPCKPSNQMHLTLGPSVIENKALRLTAEWTAGYPTPWTNISWLAIDVNNKTYNLENYGQYREYEIQVDHQKCETRLKNSFVIFPTMELNDTTVIVRPNLNTIKKFVTKEMAVGLNNVRSGSEKILVIPLNYCQTGKKESAVPHPYTVCNKYIRCTQDDLIVQQCPGGTCFYKGMLECS